ncbi:hypothetical protein GCM10018952_68640 [Streptosporangium vulgare]
MVLGLHQRVVQVTRRGTGGEQADQVHRALVQHAARRAVGVALDPAVGGVGGVTGDPGQLQGPAVHPRGVVVALDQVDRAVDDVELGAVRQAAGEGRHVPAAAVDPLVARVGGGVGGDPLQIPRQAVDPGQVAPGPLQARLHRVEVRVGEPGGEQPAVQVDGLVAGGGQARDVGLRAHGGDTAVPDQYRLGEGVGGEEDPAASEEQVAHCCTILLSVARMPLPPRGAA